MKCPKCGGTGKEYWNGNVFCNTGFECDKCNGTGEVEQTEQEYIQTCNTEQLAKVLGNIAKNSYQCGQNGKTNKCINRHNCTGYCDYGWSMWLKQPHTDKEWQK